MTQDNWYKIDGERVHYKEFYLNGKQLSMLEVYEFEKKNYDILYPKTLLEKIKEIFN